MFLQRKRFKHKLPEFLYQFCKQDVTTNYTEHKFCLSVMPSNAKHSVILCKYNLISPMHLINFFLGKKNLGFFCTDINHLCVIAIHIILSSISQNLTLHNRPYNVQRTLSDRHQNSSRYAWQFASCSFNCTVLRLAEGATTTRSLFSRSWFTAIQEVSRLESYVGMTVVSSA